MPKMLSAHLLHIMFVVGPCEGINYIYDLTQTGEVITGKKRANFEITRLKTT